MRKLVASALAALALLVPALALPAEAAGGALVKGKLLDGAGNPVAGASISFGGMGGQTTGADGSYSLQIPTGTYWASIFALVPDGEGQYHVNAAAQVAVKGDMTRDFRVPALAPVNLLLRNSDTTPAADTRILVPQSTAWRTNADGSVERWMGSPFRYASSPPITSDASGHVTFSALNDSTAVVQVDRPNTFPVKMPLRVAANPTNASLTMPTLNELSGRMTDTAGLGIPDAFVNLQAPDGTFVNGRTTQDGHYSFSMPDGTFELDMSWTAFPLAAFDSSQISGTVTVAGDTAFSAAIPRPAVVDIRLRHSDGSPATEASVTGTNSSTTLTSSAGTPLTFTARYTATTRPDAAGATTTRAIAGSQATIDVAVPGQGTITGLAEIGADPAEPTETTITIAQATATVSGVVRDDSGNPLAGASVAVRSTGTNTGTSVTTGTDGSWTAKVVPGEVELRIQHILSLDSGGYSVSALGRFPVDATASRDVALPSPTSVTARLLDASDQPVRGVREYYATSTVTRTLDGVDFEIRGGGVGSGISDASGELSILGLPESVLSGALQQADGYTFPFEVDVPSDASPVVVRMGWIGSVPSNGLHAGRVSIAGPPHTTLSELTSEPAASTPDGQAALVGRVGYTLSGVEPGSTNDITLTLPAGSQPTRVFKVAEDGTTTDATDHATISGNTIVLHLTDGGFGDADLEANGVIVDPVVPTRLRTALTTIKAPTITGVARVGSPLTASPGTWSPTAATFAYQWLADGTVITGATRATLVPTASLLGKRISVRVAASADGYDGGTAASTQTPAVVPGLIAERSRPYLVGIRRVGRLLTVRAGSWAPSGVVIRYVWLRDARAFTAPSTRSTYLQTKRDRGHRISVRVVVSKPGYGTRSATTSSAVTR